MPSILITSMGGAGSRNLVDTLRLSATGKEFEIVGTHFDPYELAKSDLEHLYLVPKASEIDAYVGAHLGLIEKHKVDVLIANSDVEVAAFSRRSGDLTCANLLPDPRQVEIVQDKYHFFRTLAKHGCDTVPNIPVETLGGVADAVAGLPPAEKFWVRLRKGAGSVGATWLTNAGQAEKWIELWCDLRGFDVSDFVFAPFLPGRDFCVATLWQDGELAVAKIYERLGYWHSDVSMSGMGSTPKSSLTVDDRPPIEQTVDAVRAICDEFDLPPHGLYQADLKCDAEGRPYVTEINIGRFPMTSPQFDRVGKYSLIELYLSLLLEPERRLPRNVYDLDPGKVILRGPDMPVMFVEKRALDTMRMAPTGDRAPDPS
jgi:hypothetical protein